MAVSRRGYLSVDSNDEELAQYLNFHFSNALSSISVELKLGVAIFHKGNRQVIIVETKNMKQLCMLVDDLAGSDWMIDYDERGINVAPYPIDADQTYEGTPIITCDNVRNQLRGWE